MNTHYVPTNHSLQLLNGRISEPTYPSSVEPSYSREMYDIQASVPSDHHRRPNHLPANLDCGYINDLNYQSRETPVADSPGMDPLYKLSETPIHKEYLDPEMCEGFSRGLNIHKSNFSHTNPSKISQSCSLQKAQRDLAWKLQSRLTPEDLISKGILLGGVQQSPNILQSRIRLERAKTSDILKKKILARPSKGKLIDGNILKELSGSPRLQQSQMSILKKQKMQRLNEKISERPGAQALIKRGILCPPAPPLSECLRRLQNPVNARTRAPTMKQEVSSQDSSDHFTPCNPGIYPPNPPSTHFDQISPSSAHNRECEISRKRTDQLRLEEASPRDADCTIIEGSFANSDNSALNQFTVSSKFECPEETNVGCKRSLSKKISIRNPPNESSLKKDLSNSSSLKTRSSKRPRKGIKTYKYHEYIPCNNSGNGLTKCKILEKTQLTKIALTESKGRGKSSMDMEVQQEQLLLQLHLLRQQYPALMPKIYNQLVTQLSQIDGKAEEAPKRSYTLEEVEGMTVCSLKAVCKENSVPSTGKKAELVMRLRGCKGVVVERVESTDVIKQEVTPLDSELSRQDLGDQSPGSKSGDDPANRDHSPSSHLSELAPEQMNTLIASPLSVLSQYSGASSDSHASENCSSAGKMASHALSVPRSEGEEGSRGVDRDQNDYSNEFDCAQGIDAVKYLDDSLCQIRNNPQMCLEKNSFHNSQLQRRPDEVINTNSQLYKLQTEHSISFTSSLPTTPGYQFKVPLHSQNKLGSNHISEQSEMSDLLHQLDSFDSYETNLNRSLPTNRYGQRVTSQYPPYYPGDIQGLYPDKPFDYLQDPSSCLDLSFPDDISCPTYPLDMMDWHTPPMANDPYPLNGYDNYDFTPMGMECIGRSPSLANSIFHNSMNNSIEQDLP